MLGWEFFKKSVTQIYYNFGDAVKITGFIWISWQLISILVSSFLIGKPSIAIYNFDPNNPTADNVENFLLAGFILLTISAIFFSWLAVLWHRFMLLNERQTTFIPKWSGRLVWLYLLKSIKVGLILVIILFILGMIAGIISAILIVTADFSSILPYFAPIFVLLGTYIFLRIALVLPAVALGKNMSIKQSWEYTISASGAIFIASILMTVLGIISQMIVTFFSTQIAQAAFLYPLISFFLDWIVIMIGISILTTLYGYLVEERNL